jgi:hypothetical protein
MNKFLRASRELEKELGHTPANDEIGRRMDIPVEKVQKLKTILRDPVSLETPVGREGESVLSDLIEDRWVGSPVDAVIEGNVRDWFRNFNSSLARRPVAAAAGRYLKALEIAMILASSPMPGPACRARATSPPHPESNVVAEAVSGGFMERLKKALDPKRASSPPAYTSVSLGRKKRSTRS